MIDPTMSAAVGGLTGAATNHAVNSAMAPIPTWIKVGGLAVILGLIIWWYFIATEKHRSKVRKVTKRR